MYRIEINNGAGWSPYFVGGKPMLFQLKTEAAMFVKNMKATVPRSSLRNYRFVNA